MCSSRKVFRSAITRKLLCCFLTHRLSHEPSSAIQPFVRFYLPSHVTDLGQVTATNNSIWRETGFSLNCHNSDFRGFLQPLRNILLKEGIRLLQCLLHILFSIFFSLLSIFRNSKFWEELSSLFSLIRQDRRGRKRSRTAIILLFTERSPNVVLLFWLHFYCSQASCYSKVNWRATYCRDISYRPFILYKCHSKLQGRV